MGRKLIGRHIPTNANLDGNPEHWKGCGQTFAEGYLSFYDSNHKEYVFKDYPKFSQSVTATRIFDPRRKGTEGLSDEGHHRNLDIGFREEHRNQPAAIHHIDSDCEDDGDDDDDANLERFNCDVILTYQPRLARDTIDSTGITKESAKRTMDKFVEVSVTAEPPKNKCWIMDPRFNTFSDENPDSATGVLVKSYVSADCHFGCRILSELSENEADNFLLSLNLADTRPRDKNDTQAIEEIKELFNYPGKLPVDMACFMTVRPLRPKSQRTAGSSANVVPPTHSGLGHSHTGPLGGQVPALSESFSQLNVGASLSPSSMMTGAETEIKPASMSASGSASKSASKKKAPSTGKTSGGSWRRKKGSWFI